eukprot:Lankesteria_metandrocarpae@DN7608_c0_g1_i1.p1
MDEEAAITGDWHIDDNVYDDYHYDYNIGGAVECFPGGATPIPGTEDDAGSGDTIATTAGVEPSTPLDMWRRSWKRQSLDSYTAPLSAARRTAAVAGGATGSSDTVGAVPNAASVQGVAISNNQPHTPLPMMISSDDTTPDEKVIERGHANSAVASHLQPRSAQRSILRTSGGSAVKRQPSAARRRPSVSFAPTKQVQWLSPQRDANYDDDDLYGDDTAGTSENTQQNMNSAANGVSSLNTGVQQHYHLASSNISSIHNTALLYSSTPNHNSTSTANLGTGSSVYAAGRVVETVHLTPLSEATDEDYLGSSNSHCSLGGVRSGGLRMRPPTPLQQRRTIEDDSYDYNNTSNANMITANTPYGSMTAAAAATTANSTNSSTATTTGSTTGNGHQSGGRQGDFHQDAPPRGATSGTVSSG